MTQVKGLSSRLNTVRRVNRDDKGVMSRKAEGC
jgi:hypothetical protein